MVKSSARNGLYFKANNALKSPPSTSKSISFLRLSLRNFFRLVFDFRQADRPKTRLCCSTWTCNCTSRPPVLSFEIIHLCYILLRFKPWGLAPIPPASTLAQKQGDSKNHTNQKKTGLISPVFFFGNKEIE